MNWGFNGQKCSFTCRHIAEPIKQIFEIIKSSIDPGIYSSTIVISILIQGENISIWGLRNGLKIAKINAAKSCRLLRHI